MADTFDAPAKALELENLAKTYLDNIPGDYPIEQTATREEAKLKLQSELNDLASNQPKFDAVGKELEKLSAYNFSTLPNVEIAALFGHVGQVTFKPSFWDLSASINDSFDFVHFPEFHRVKNE
jgi:hypothetical protein